MVRVTYVTCPKCNKEFYLHTADYRENKDAYLHCPFCTHEFTPQEGNLYPPLEREK